MSGALSAGPPAHPRQLGYTGDLNANQTSVDGGGAIQGVASGAGTTIANNQIGINASGQLTGITARNATAVGNNQLSITSNGVLLNAGSNQGQITTLPAPDTRNDNQPPSWYNQGTTNEFKARAALAAPGTETYGILRTEKPWTDASGGVVTQTFKSNDGEWKRTSVPGNYGAWAAWSVKFDRPLTAGNISTFISGAAIGTAQIANAAIGTAQIANAAIGAAQIADLSVGTIKIANNAVTVPLGASLVSNWSPPGTSEATAFTIGSMDTGGAPLFVIVSVAYSSTGASFGNSDHLLRLRINGALIWMQPIVTAPGFTAEGNITRSAYIANPGGGYLSITLTAEVPNRSLTLLSSRQGGTSALAVGCKR